MCDEVRVASVSELLPDESAYARAYATLPAWRRARCERLGFAADRFGSVAGWLLVRRLLAERGVDADALAVRENAFGKPEFVGCEGLHFSISHTAGHVMAAVSERPVGCDVERIAPVEEAVMRAALTGDEFGCCEGFSSGPQRDACFCRLWVRKESYVKALGIGLGREPRSFSVLNDAVAPGWCIRDIPAGAFYCAAVCSFR